ncbi:MAG: hypothetical protein ACRD6B_25635, partial [Bryobacteraceae bacterium]
MSSLDPRAARDKAATGSDQSGSALSGAPPPTGRTDLLKRAALALSIANFCFLYMWSEILHVASDRRLQYVLAAPPDALFFLALLLDVVVLAAIVFLLLLLRRSGSRALKFSSSAVLVLACLFALYQCQTVFNSLFQGVIRNRSILEIRLVLAAVILFLIILWRKRALHGLRTFFLVLSPLFFVFAAEGIVLYSHPSSARYTPHIVGPLPVTTAAPHHRVIWIIFDELDRRLAFDDRPARIQLPQFDALRRTSIFGDRVKSPAHNTLSAVLSLLFAKTIPADEDVNLYAHPVHVKFSGCSQWASLPAQQNIFRRARALGFNTAVSGWYHPYCRYFGSDLSACASTVGASIALIPQQLLRSQPFLEKAAYLANWQARSLPLARRFGYIASMPHEAKYFRELHIIRNKGVMEQGIQMLRNPKLNFVLLHLPIPHPPGIWNTRTQSFSTDARLDYIDNLELADRRLGQIRKVLEQTGDWDGSTILVSADHPYRPGLWLNGLAASVLPPAARLEMKRDTGQKWQPYIPFILKMP